MSQNCVIRISPPGALKQQRSAITVVFEQLKGRSAGQLTDVAMVIDEPMANMASTSATLECILLGLN